MRVGSVVSQGERAEIVSLGVREKSVVSSDRGGVRVMGVSNERIKSLE